MEKIKKRKMVRKDWKIKKKKKNFKREYEKSALYNGLELNAMDGTH